MFNVDDMIRKLEVSEQGSKAQAMLTVVDIFKHREICRHLSNGADRLAWAADRLHASDALHKIAAKSVSE